jgi:hypothetical protein
MTEQETIRVLFIGQHSRENVEYGVFEFTYPSDREVATVLLWMGKAFVLTTVNQHMWPVLTYQEVVEWDIGDATKID